MLNFSVGPGQERNEDIVKIKPETGLVWTWTVNDAAVGSDRQGGRERGHAVAGRDKGRCG